MPYIIYIRGAREEGLIEPQARLPFSQVSYGLGLLYLAVLVGRDSGLLLLDQNENLTVQVHHK